MIKNKHLYSKASYGNNMKKQILLLPLVFIFLLTFVSAIPIIWHTSSSMTSGSSDSLWYNNSGTIQNNNSMPVAINNDLLINNGGAITASTNSFLNPHTLGNTYISSETGDALTISGGVTHTGNLLHQGQVVQGTTSISSLDTLAFSVNHDALFEEDVEIQDDLSVGGWVNASYVCDINGDCLHNVSGGGSSGIWSNISGVATYQGNIKSGDVDSYNGLFSEGQGSVAHGFSECTVPFLCDLGGVYGVNYINSSGLGSFANGYASGFNKYSITSSGKGCTALGSTISGSLICSGEGSIAVGSETTVSGDTSGSFGRKNLASGVSSFAFGYDNDAIGTYALAMGWGNTVSGNTVSMALGKFNTVSSTTAGAFGSDNTVDENGAYVFGINIDTDTSNTVYIGKDDNYLKIDGSNIKLNSTLNTGSNAGTGLCVDTNNNLCLCGSCA